MTGDEAVIDGPAIDGDDHILGRRLLERVDGVQDSYDFTAYMLAGLPVRVSCTTCGKEMSGADARLYEQTNGYLVYCDNEECVS